MEASYLNQSTRTLTPEQHPTPPTLAHRRAPAITATASGTLVKLGGLFLLLAAFEILPQSVNAASECGTACKVVGVVMVLLGAATAACGIYYTATSPSSDTRVATQALEDVEDISSASILDILNKSLIDDSSLNYVGAGKRRIAWIVGESKLVLKCPRFPGASDLGAVQRECIMYAMSETLGFGIVPSTYYFPPESPEALLIAERCTKPIPPFIAAQRIHPGWDAQFDLDHAHKAIFFTWISGRGDTKKANSITDKEGKVWEIDNELADERLDRRIRSQARGGQESHWLIDESMSQKPISQALLDWVLQLPEKIALSPTSLPDGFEVDTITFHEELYGHNINILKIAILQAQSSDRAITLEVLKDHIKHRYLDV